MFLCLATAVLLHPCCYQKEGARTFLVCSCKSIGDQLHTYAYASGSRRTLSLYLTGTLWPNTRSINMAKKGAKKAAAEAPAPKKATTISANVDMQFSDLVGMLLQICICSSQHFFLHHTLNAALWTESLAPLPDGNRGKILREIFRSLCWRPQTSPARVGSSKGWLLAPKGKLGRHQEKMI